MTNVSRSRQVPAMPETPAGHVHGAGCLCPLAPVAIRPYHVFTFDSGDVADAECIHGCGTTWGQILAAADVQTRGER